MAFLRRGRGPGGRGRAKLKRELRSLEDLREEELRHLGGLALEMHRHERMDFELLMEKAQALADLEDEIGLLSRELGAPAPPRDPARPRGGQGGTGS